LPAPEPGRVYLVGAGPGDPGLLTARALELIEHADVILHDRLIPAAALGRARPDAELVYVGKQGGGPSVAQERSEQLMIARAGEGKSVVRLKGGDPFVFGRGGEEALALRAAGVAFEVVPGVTAGIAVPAYAGIPVTHRGRAGAVALVTAHEDPAKEGGVIDWPALAGFPGTLVFYMGVGRLEQLTAALLEAGRDPLEPAAIVHAGTLPEQRTVSGTLSSIAGRAREQRLAPPAIAVVGEVAALAEELSWLGEGALAGRAVAVTRARAQASALAARLEALGASVVLVPAIRVHPLPGPALDPAPYDLVCLTSANGVDLFFERLAAGGRDARALAGVRVAAIGRATAAALAARGVIADVVPERYVAEALVEALADVPVRRALVARALHAREVLPEALRARGAEVDVLPLYETVAEPLAPQALAAASAADYITFTSSSTVSFFLQALPADGGISSRTRIVSIGPVTSEALRAHGLEVHVEAARHDTEGVVQALIADARGDGRDA
jgi:uroporphyrinogen III methyltransferase / synthase